jgi:hypothetical protein
MSWRCPLLAHVPSWEQSGYRLLNRDGRPDVTRVTYKFSFSGMSEY